MSPLEVRTLPVESLIPAEYNPRKVLQPTDPAYKKLRASLVEFGLVEPLVWNELTGRVVGGHARLRILKELGVKEVPVSVVRLDEVREKALNIVLNNQEAQSRYDSTKLHELLSELEGEAAMHLSGFDDSILGVLKFAPTGEIPEEDEQDRVEVTLVTDEATFAGLEQPLDSLIREFDLEAHVKHA